MHGGFVHTIFATGLLNDYLYNEVENVFAKMVLLTYPVQVTDH